MAKPWEKYQQEQAQATAGPWNKYAQAEAPSEGPSKAQTALESYGNAATLGYLPHIQVALEVDPNKDLDAKLAAQGFNISQPDSSYVSRRDANIKRIAEQEAANPNSALLGKVAGIGASMLLPAGAIAKEASLASKIISGAKTGAIYGAAANPGDVAGELSPLQLEERAKAGAIGAGIGAAAPVLVEGIQAGARGASNLLKDVAERRAFKALGPYQRQAVQNADNINEIGRVLLDEGVVNAKPTSYAGLEARAAAAKYNKGKEIGNIVDELASKADGQNTSRAEIVEKVREASMPDARAIGVKPEAQKVSSLVDELAAGKDLSLKDIRDLKAATGKQINWDRLPGADIPTDEKFQRALYSKLVEAENNIAENLASSGNSKLKDAKAAYGALAKAEKISGSREAKEFANRLISPSDYGVGIGGAALLGPKGAALAVANNLGRKYGNQVIASGSDAISRALSKAGNVNLSGATRDAVIAAASRAKMGSADSQGSLDPSVIEQFRQNPKLIEFIQDPIIRAEIERRLGRSPSSR